MSLPTRATTRLRLAGFSKHQAALVREMEDFGWTGRIGSNGHAFMLAPDGVTTCSVVPKDGSPRQRGNSRAVFKAWLKTIEELSAEALERAEERKVEEALAKMRFASKFRPPLASVEDVNGLLDLAIPHRIPDRAAEAVPAPVDTESSPEPTPAPVRAPSEFACPICGREFAGRQPLAVHHVRSHVKVACPVCDKQLAPGNLPRHQQKYHPPRPVEELQREVFQLRQEAASWQALAEEAEEAVAEMTRLGVEAEGRYAALRERYNAVVQAAHTLQSVIEQ